MSYGFLTPDELSAALTAKHRDELLIGGSVDHGAEMITLWRANLSRLTVPFSAFKVPGTGLCPDFHRFGIADYGHAIRLGKYEASTSSILYEYDAEYRRRMKKRRQASERTFGASLRRLRKQRRLRQEDFAPQVAAKTIARIEQGLVKKVHPGTLEKIADRLGVRPEEIKEY